jgi:mRNA interferase MazF
MPQYGDLLVCGVSTQVHQEVAGFDETIRPGDPDFVGSGLKHASVIRLGFLVVLPAANFIGAIGAIGADRHHRLLERLARHIASPSEKKQAVAGAASHRQPPTRSESPQTTAPSGTHIAPLR